MAKMLYALFILCFFALHSTATNVTIYITSAHDLTEKLSPGLNFSGTTLLVTNDLDFSNEKFAPIGASPSSRFSGVFNGQGHVISNLVMNTSESYVGLFGFSWGTTIRNIILDASCSVTCTHNSSETKPGSYVGSIIGYCEEEETSCIIRNNVNMGNVSFSGSEDGSLYLGGIAGYLSSRNEYFVKNLANYGPVTLSTVGEKTLSAYVGGIIGRALGGSLSEKCVLQNSLNFGALTVNCDSVKMLSIGGVVGYIEYGTIENCVSAGTIESNKDSEYIGMLAGYLSRSSYPYFYWDIAKYNKVCGKSASVGSSEIRCFNTSSSSPSTLSKVTSFGVQDLSVALNKAVETYVQRDYSPWMLNWDRSKINFTINSKKDPIVMDYPIILLPSLANGKTLWFDGWYIDQNVTVPFDKFSNVTHTAFYGTWVKNYKYYTISFDTNGGTTVEPIIEQYGNVTQLRRNTTKESCTLAWWEDDYHEKAPWDFTVPAHNVTLHAIWDCSTISTVKDFTNFIKFVNSGTNYKEKTVYLGADIDFNGAKIDPVGYSLTSSSNPIAFLGTFDGRGYTLSNFKVQTSSTLYVGLFGYSEGATIRNVVISKSCSVVNSYRASFEQDVHTFTGGIIGFCEAYSGPCMVENSINVASVSFMGETNNNLYLGGIAGFFTSFSDYGIYIKDCANYGHVSNKGGSGTYADIAGIIAGCDGNSKYAYIENCLNYGAVTQSGKTNYPCIGGIIGYNRYTYVKNCVNVGPVTSTKEGKRIGAITGEARYSFMSYCYYVNATGISNFGKVTSSNVTGVLKFSNISFELSSPASVGDYNGKSLIGVLNAYVASNSERNHSNWASNVGGNNISFIIDRRSMPLITVDSQIILFPNIAEDKKVVFDGWYTDAGYVHPLKDYKITNSMNLYGKIVEVKVDDLRQKTSILLIIAIICSIAVVVLVAFGLIGFTKVIRKVKANKEMKSLLEPLVFDVMIDSLNEMTDLYPEDYERPTIEEALVSTGVSEDIAREIAAKCNGYAQTVQEMGRLPEGVTVDDAAAVALYTMETAALKKSPYRLINEALMNGTHTALEPVKDILYLVMTALRKMPIVHSKPLYRGIRSDVIGVNDELDENSDNNESENGTSFRQDQYNGDVSIVGNDYAEGEEVVWLALSSTSPDVAVTKAFLARGSNSGKAEGTLFIIESGWGYNVQPCSMYPDETEIVLEPERRFKVKSIISGERLTIVKMEMLKTPLVLPSVFGKKEFALF